MASRVVLLLGLVVVAGVLVVTLAPEEPRRSGTNNVPATAPVVRLAPEADECQDEDVPEATRALRLRAEPRGSQRVAVRVVASDGAVVRGRAASVDDDGNVDVELPRRPAPGAGTVCVRNASARQLALVGFPTGERAGRPTGPIAIDYYRAGRESWWQIAGAVADRAAFGMSRLLGGAALLLAALLLIGAWGLAVAALWRIGAER
jgi:hypothetical protein